VHHPGITGDKIDSRTLKGCINSHGLWLEINQHFRLDISCWSDNPGALPLAMFIHPFGVGIGSDPLPTADWQLVLPTGCCASGTARHSLALHWISHRRFLTWRATLRR